MTRHRIRAARPSDVKALYELAKLTGGGFTNLPADRPTLEAKLDRSEAGFSREGESQSDDLYVFMLEDVTTGQLRGNRASTFSSRSSKRIDSITNSTTSTSEMDCVTVRFITRFNTF